MSKSTKIALAKLREMLITAMICWACQKVPLQSLAGNSRMAYVNIVIGYNNVERLY